MSDDQDVSRRKLLLTAGGLGSTALVPSVAAAESDDTHKPTKAEVQQALAEMDMQPTKQSAGARSAVGTLSSSPSSLEDADIYVGENKNARTPMGKPFAVETYEESLTREAPPGFPKHYFDDDAVTADSVSTASLPSFYLRENFGELSFGEYSFKVGFGMGVDINASPKGFEAEASVDLHVGGATVSLSSFGIGYGKEGSMFCFSPSTKWNMIDIDFDVCPVISFKGSEFKVGGRLKVCAAPPCGPLNCKYCQKVYLDFSKHVPLP
ncbi:hypothetical protein C440_01515 [Haloferax mucosum ATCC BAA-1512]|uniref:Uncharacterized protein n=1 Tax=Haloferax mucosum ATCC BAA-1512 TaxID=662479 RepID=M0IT86_9EURY|nr:hypothetical protein [Haloferax mucosum]ELZ98993.1 hypothetical protein C440_01515 [Haloferax mucosum ATCC BAA-1512]